MPTFEDKVYRGGQEVGEVAGIGDSILRVKMRDGNTEYLSEENFNSGDLSLDPSRKIGIKMDRERFADRPPAEEEPAGEPEEPAQPAAGGPGKPRIKVTPQPDGSFTIESETPPTARPTPPIISITLAGADINLIFLGLAARLSVPPPEPDLVSGLSLVMVVITKAIFISSLEDITSACHHVIFP